MLCAEDARGREAGSERDEVSAVRVLLIEDE